MIHVSRRINVSRYIIKYCASISVYISKEQTYILNIIELTSPSKKRYQISRATLAKLSVAVILNVFCQIH